MDTLNIVHSLLHTPLLDLSHFPIRQQPALRHIVCVTFISRTALSTWQSRNVSYHSFALIVLTQILICLKQHCTSHACLNELTTHYAPSSAATPTHTFIGSASQVSAPAPTTSADKQTDTPKVDNAYYLSVTL